MAKQSSDEVDKLFQIPLAQFTSARNTLAAKLKKDGDTEGAERVKTLSKPSISAWVANQLYWRHRKPFERLLAAGDQFRKAQAAQLAGKSSDLRAPLEGRREALAELTHRAAEVLRDAGHPASPDTMRRVTTTLEALATYGQQPDAPQAGRLTADVDPPGFEALAALVPRGIDRVGHRQRPPRVIPFNQPKPKPTKEEGAERRAREAEARKELREAERALAQAKKAAASARLAMKTAAARAKAAEKAKATLEAKFEKLTAAAESARQDARRVASQAEEAAQAVDDAERAVKNAREKLKG